MNLLYRLFKKNIKSNIILLFLISSIHAINDNDAYYAHIFCVSRGYQVFMENVYLPHMGYYGVDYSVYIWRLSLKGSIEMGEVSILKDWPLANDTIVKDSRFISADMSMLFGYTPGVEHGAHLTFYVGPTMSGINPYYIINKNEINQEFPTLFGAKIGFCVDFKLSDVTESHSGVGIRTDMGAVFVNYNKIDNSIGSGKIYFSIGFDVFVKHD